MKITARPPEGSRIVTRVPKIELQGILSAVRSGDLPDFDAGGSLGDPGHVVVAILSLVEYASLPLRTKY